MESQEPRDANAASDAGEDARAARRRFGRGGLASAPVLLSVVSRPVLATGNCKAASAFSSANLSRQTNGEGTCTGCKPTYWAALAPANWPPNTPLPTTLFTTALGPNAFAANATLANVLAMGETSNAIIIARLAVAAYFNSKSGKTPDLVLSAATAKIIWSSFYSNSYFQPTAGVKWYFDYSVPAATTGGLKQWLETTMPN